jgi:TPP-dependent pyruvate/acetoin dehydrogenase alpha subunit
MTAKKTNIQPTRLNVVSTLINEQGITKADMLTYLRQIMEIRALENNIANLLSKAVLKGASHLYAGEEAVAVGAVATLSTSRCLRKRIHH